MVFGLVVEVLTRLFYKAQQCREISGFYAKEGGSKYPILQFADHIGVC